MFTPNKYYNARLEEIKLPTFFKIKKYTNESIIYENEKLAIKNSHNKYKILFPNIKFENDSPKIDVIINELNDNWYKFKKHEIYHNLNILFKGYFFSYTSQMALAV